MFRESRYLRLLRRKNATGRRDGKRKQASIREPRGSLIHSLTEHCQIAIERTIIERAKFDLHHAGMGYHRPSNPEEWSQSMPSGMSVRSWKVLVTGPHHHIRQCDFTDRHHLIFAVIQFIHGSL